jgi:hypothetical protein
MTQIVIICGHDIKHKEYFIFDVDEGKLEKLGVRRRILLKWKLQRENLDSSGS